MVEFSEKISRVTVHVLVITSLFLLLFSPFFESQTEQIGLVCADGVERQLPDAYPDALSNDAKEERTAKCWGYDQSDFEGLANQKLTNRLKKGFTTENIQKGVDWHTGKMDATCSLSNVHFMIQALDYKVNNEGLPWHSPERIMQPTSPMGGADMSDNTGHTEDDSTLVKLEAATQTALQCSTPDSTTLVAGFLAYSPEILARYPNIRDATNAAALKTALEDPQQTLSYTPGSGSGNSDGSITLDVLGDVLNDLFNSIGVSAARLRTNTSSVGLRSRRDPPTGAEIYAGKGSDCSTGFAPLTQAQCTQYMVESDTYSALSYVDLSNKPKGCYIQYADSTSTTITGIYFNEHSTGALSDSASKVCIATSTLGSSHQALLTGLVTTVDGREALRGFLADDGDYPCAAFSKAQCGQCGSAKSNIGGSINDQFTGTAQCRWVVNPEDNEFGICAPSDLAQLFYKGNDKNFFEAEATIPGECFGEGKEDFKIPGVWHTTDVRSGPLYFENNGTCGDRGGLAYIPSYPSCVIKNVLDSEFPDSAIMLITSIVLYFIITVVSFMKVENKTLGKFVEFTFLVTFVFTVATAGVITDTLIKAHPADNANGNDVFAQLFDAIYMLGLFPNAIRDLVAVGASLVGIRAVGGDIDGFSSFDGGSILFGTPRAEIVDGRTFGTHNYVGWYHPHNSHVTPMATGAIVVLWVSLVVHIGISYRNRFTDEMAYVPLLG